MRVGPLCTLVAVILATSSTRRDATAQPRTEANVPVEISFTSRSPHADPFNAVTLDVIFTDPKNAVFRVPAFWAGGSKWKARYASPIVGTHKWRTECNFTNDAGLNGVTGQVEVSRYRGTNPPYQHGPIRVARDARHFEHIDGAPFFWLGDTWWMGLCHRLSWPDDFKQLTADRKAKGFNVIQIVAGLYPDMFPFDPRGANEAGFPWQTNYTSIRPEYFDAADRRIQYLIDEGFTPCIVGAWGYFLPWMGVEKAKQHWRYLIARYGSSPVVWCVAGEANLPWYLAKGFPYDDRAQVRGWSEVMRYVRETDPFHRMVTIHPTGLGRLNARGAVTDESLLDFDMLQTPHGQREAVAPTVAAVEYSFTSRPKMPVLDGEASYEKLNDSIPAEWPRAMFWLCMVNGAAGHTYGANGIWQCNQPGKPHGASPHGGSYGNIPWNEAMHLAGSRQVGAGKKFLDQFPWQQGTPMPGTVAWVGGKSAITWGDWIWFPEGDPKQDAPKETRFFRRTFEVPKDQSIRSASLTIAVDNKYTVWLNEHELGSGNDWHLPGNYDVANLVKPGQNILAVRAENAPPETPNPAGLIASLQIDFANGTNMIVRSDKDWRVVKTAKDDWRKMEFNDSDWQPALGTVHYGEGPWGRIGNDEPSFAPYALGISDRLRIIYALTARPVRVSGLRAKTKYRLTMFDPVACTQAKPSEITSDAEGRIICPAPGHGPDWVAALELK